MMTLATIPKHDDLSEIYFDMDDSGHFYLKQDDDWIVVDRKTLVLLIDALIEQQNR